MEGEDDLFVFSFFTDIAMNPDIIELVQRVQNDIKQTLTTLQRYLTRWKKYRGIWKVDKVSMVRVFHLIKHRERLFGVKPLRNSEGFNLFSFCVNLQKEAISNNRGTLQI